MPKIVDHEERRAELVDAVLRVIERDGVSAVSVRAVAAEAGRSPGSLRHYFSSQAELIAFTMAALASRVAERVRRKGRSGATALDLLSELLPLDADRVAEFEVWLELTTLSRTEPDLAPLVAEAHEGIDSVCRWAVHLTAPDLSDARRRALVAELHALLDGLALHLSLAPDRMDARRARGVIRAWLSRVAAG
ncbi:TetR/AcrR family transcriptional regulator [Nocardioides rotundus]|uniref:TetR/AcrR family transcriptional regulator n=1 Tax=Nocardioides rotundus TaxID=1774216 RepID=UPI001CC0837D|nr:TetR/AcrR family transcriptional regulator [Nocardioides rotundus]UAL30858.1 TetR/AcrR family transcriptional regulator [Nocardioides rotundus]